MNKNTMIALVTVLIVVAFGGTCIGFLGHSFWTFEKSQRGEMVVNPDKIEVSYVGVQYDPFAGFEDRGDCCLVLNVTNKHNFSWARIHVDVNYTYRGEESNTDNSMYGLGINETRTVALIWGCPTTSPENCKEEIYKDWQVTEIIGHKYEEEGQ